MSRARRGRGEGNISFREDKGLWTARLSLGFDGNGRRSRKTVYGASSTTRKAAGVVLGIALRNAVRMRLIPANPAADVKKPKAKPKEIVFLSAGQAKRFLELAKASRNFALYALGLGSGMRMGEMLS